MAIDVSREKEGDTSAGTSAKKMFTPDG